MKLAADAVAAGLGRIRQLHRVVDRRAPALHGVLGNDAGGLGDGVMHFLARQPSNIVTREQRDLRFGPVTRSSGN